MKMIICAKRHPGMTREIFFDYLQNIHWPLIQRYPSVSAALDGYIQNHTLGDGSPGNTEAPFSVARDRDSVIELYFGDGREGLARLVQIPDYLEHIRPDEGRFNDLPANIMVKTRPELLFENSTVGRCKRFDFMVRTDGVAPEQFTAALKQDGQRLCSDPSYTTHIDRHLYNIPGFGGEGQGFGAGKYDCVREIWASSFAALAAVAHKSTFVEADQVRSFSVFANEFVMKARTSKGSND